MFRLEHNKIPFSEKEKNFEEFRKVLEERKINYFEKDTSFYRSIVIIGKEIRVELAPHSCLTREKNGTLQFWKGARYGYADSLEDLIHLL